MSKKRIAKEFTFYLIATLLGMAGALLVALWLG